MNETGNSAATIWHGTTIVTVRKGDAVVVAGDGQVSLSNTVIKGNARKCGLWARVMSSPVLQAQRQMP
jgi:ATP-dependent protease HslVU (ClpYQ) peptidase subunit